MCSMRWNETQPRLEEYGALSSIATFAIAQPIEDLRQYALARYGRAEPAEWHNGIRTIQAR